MFKQGDVILIGENAPSREYVGTIFRMLGDLEEVGLDGLSILSGRAEVLKTEVAGLQDWETVDFNFTERWRAALEKIGEGDIYVGQRVRIREGSQFYGWDRVNPAGVVGEVTHFRPDAGLQLIVAWENGFSNGYSFEDLEVATEAPKPRKKVKKSSGILAQLNKAVEVLHSYNDHPTASYVVIKKGVMPERREMNTNCHQGLRGAGKDSILVVSDIRRGIDEHPWFYKWLIDESPWSSAFYRRYAWSRKNKVVAVRTDVAANFMFGACFATRIWEYPEQFKVLSKLRRKVELGFVYPMLLQITQYDVKGKGKLGLYCAGGGHWPFAGSPSKTVVSNFYKGVPVTLEETYRKQGTCGYSVSKTFGTDGNQEWLVEEFYKFEKAKFVETGWRLKRYYVDSVNDLAEFFNKVKQEVVG